MNNKKFEGVLSVLAAFSLSLGGVSAIAAPAQKYDAQLMPLLSPKGLSNAELYDRAFVETANDGITPTVRTLVRFTGDGVASMEALGARVTSVSGDVAAVEVPLSNLKKIV